MSKFKELHPDIDEGFCNIYKRLSMDGKLLEQWEKNDNGILTDVTLREQLKIQIEDEEREIKRLEFIERIRKAKEKLGESNGNC